MLLSFIGGSPSKVLDKGVILFFISKIRIYIVCKPWFKKLLVPDRSEAFEKLADGGVGMCKYHGTFVT